MPTTTPGPSVSVDGVLVVGGGYAGLHAAGEARRRRVPATVIDRRDHHDFVTRLAAVAGGTAPPGDASSPLGEFAPRLELGEVVRAGDGWVTLADGRTVVAEALVLAVGSRPSRPPIEGLEGAHTLRSAEDAHTLRHLIPAGASVVIIGGGPTGVQLAGAVAHAHPDVETHLLEAADHLLPGMPRALGDGAGRILRGRGVDVRVGASVRAIDDRGVRTDDDRVDGLVVWAGGFSSPAADLDLPVDGGGAEVDDCLRVAGMTRTFAAGDLAAHRDGDGRPLAMSAQVAVRAGAAAGANAARLLRGREPEPVELGHLGWVLDLGGGRGVARVGPLSLAGPWFDLLPPLLHDLVDLRNLVEIGGIGALRHAPSSLVGLLGGRTAFPPRQPAGITG